MKKAAILTLILALITLPGCDLLGDKPEEPVSSPEASSESTTINLWSFSNEVQKMVEVFISNHPELKIKLNSTILATSNNEYQPALDRALKAGGKDAPDIYVAEADFVLKYTKGSMASYAIPYADLGINIDKAIEDAQIVDYVVDIGRNPNGNIAGLAYQTTGGCFIYRRSVAKQIFGTDNPVQVQEAIGGGSGDWGNFLEAAEKCGSKNVAILSNTDSIWRVIEPSAEKGWIVDDKLNIDPKREEFLDLSRKLYENNWTNKTTEWTTPWYDDMKGTGAKPVLGFFGPSWLIYYNIAGNCGGTKVGEGTYGDWAVCSSPVPFTWGGSWLLANKNLNSNSKKKEIVKAILNWITLDASETGLQYMWANGSMNGIKDTVASSKVMSMVNGEEAFLGGQDMFEYFIPANENASVDTMTLLDSSINYYWKEVIQGYSIGMLTREAAITEFKNEVFEYLGIPSADDFKNTITIEKNDSPYNQQPYYDFIFEAKYFTDNFEIPEPGEKYILQLSGKASETMDAPLIALLFLNSQNGNKKIGMEMNQLKSKAGENFTTTYIFEIPSDFTLPADSKVCVELAYDTFYFDKPLTISDFKIKHINEDSIKPLISYNYHIGEDIFTEYYVQDEDYFLQINAALSDWTLCYFYGYNYWHHALLGWYDNPQFTGSPITKISAADNTTNRDFYAKTNYLVRKKTWDNNGVEEYAYTIGSVFHIFGLNKSPVPGSTFPLEITGNTLNDFNGTVTVKILDGTTDAWPTIICGSPFVLNNASNTSFIKRAVINLPSDIQLPSLNNLVLEFVFNFADKSEEKEFAISDLTVTEIPESEMLTYTYYVGSNKIQKSVFKDYDYTLPASSTWWDEFGRNFTEQDFLGWYENSDFTGNSVSSVSAEQNTADKTFYAKWNLKLDYTLWEGNEFYSNMTRFMEILPSITTVPAPGTTYKLRFTGIAPKKGSFNFGLTDIIQNGNNWNWQHFDGGWFSHHVEDGAFDFTVDFTIPQGATLSSLFGTGLKEEFRTDDGTYSQEPLIIRDYKVTLVE